MNTTSLSLTQEGKHIFVLISSMELKGSHENSVIRNYHKFELRLGYINKPFKIKMQKSKMRRKTTWDSVASNPSLVHCLLPAMWENTLGVRNWIAVAAPFSLCPTITPARLVPCCCTEMFPQCCGDIVLHPPHRGEGQA